MTDAHTFQRTVLIHKEGGLPDLPGDFKLGDVVYWQDGYANKLNFCNHSPYLFMSADPEIGGFLSESTAIDFYRNYDGKVYHFGSIPALAIKGGIRSFSFQLPNDSSRVDEAVNDCHADLRKGCPCVIPCVLHKKFAQLRNDMQNQQKRKEVMQSNGSVTNKPHIKHQATEEIRAKANEENPSVAESKPTTNEKIKMFNDSLSLDVA